MLSRVAIPGTWMWSAWQPDRGMNFNSYVFERGDGCVAVDPLTLDEASLEHLSDLGGVRTVVLTNGDHQRAAAALRERFGARIIAHEPEARFFDAGIDAVFNDGDEVFPGARAIAIPDGKTPGEVALHLPAARAALVGDALIGAPAGALSLLPDEKLASPERLVFALRRLWALQLETLLLCDGQPIFASADTALAKLLEKRIGAELYRINAEQIRYEHDREREPYVVEDGEVGLLIGSRKLGYRLARLAPGKAFCPLHWHVQCEEFFYVFEGRPSIRTLQGTIECRPGDFVAFPTGESGAHQLRNDSDEPCLVLLVGMEEPAVNLEACYYPDSAKVGMWTTTGRLGMVRSSPDLDYYDGE
ncbi:MAG TPA: cupin domain-containing protein [Candidatus Baltobacteraceae bacterium]|nr:cupin domain-containing protein [Candidatus Baltobacteraceae bacterium]